MIITKEQLKLIGVSILCLLFCVLAFTIDVKAQTVAKTANGYNIEIADEEKAIKASIACIKAKTNYEWTTNTSTLIKWKLEFFKDSKKYILYKNGIKDYESSTISGIKSKYVSDLLGREVNIQ